MPKSETKAKAKAKGKGKAKECTCNARELKQAFQKAPNVIVLAGVPGCGKSVFAKKLAGCACAERGLHVGNWVIVSSDELGRAKSIESFNAALKQPTSRTKIIVDKVNATKSDRAVWLAAFHASKLKKFKCVCVYFHVDAEVCVRRIQERKDHPTLPGDRADAAVTSFMKVFEDPLIEEGFDAVYNVNPDEVQDLFTKMSGCSCQYFDIGDCANTQCDGIPKKFPRTQHIVNLGSAARDDLLMDASEAQKFINSEAAGITVTVEEKIDGANLGLYLEHVGGSDPWSEWKVRCINRSKIVTCESGSQWKALDMWIEAHKAELIQLLRGDYMLYGEWLFAQHTVYYDRLPGYFICFDIFDVRRSRFLSVKRRNEMVEQFTTIPVIHCIYRGKLSGDDYIRLLQSNSAYRSDTDSAIEGIYVRIDDDEDEYLLERGKIVNREFLGAMEDGHWSKKQLVKNKLAIGFYII